MASLIDYNPAETVHVTKYLHVFDYEGHTGWGYSFDCEQDGTPLPMPDVAYANYQLCIEGRMEPPVVDKGVVDFSYAYRQEPYGTCPYCGDTVVICGGLGSDCECGKSFDYGGNEVLYTTRAGYEEQGGYYAAGEYWDEEDY